MYVILLVVAKFLRAVGLFICYDLLKIIPVVQFLFLIKFWWVEFILYTYTQKQSSDTYFCRVNKNTYLPVICCLEKFIAINKFPMVNIFKDIYM